MFSLVNLILYLANLCSKILLDVLKTSKLDPSSTVPGAMCDLRINQPCQLMFKY